MSDKARPNGRPPHILVLGGTTEASALVRMLAPLPAFDVTLSLAGRTAAPRLGPARTRIGGFGGVDALAAWIAENRVDLVVDATHPFAAQISRNAAEACARTGTAILAIRRPAWARVAGDDWTEVASIAESVAALGDGARRVFLTIGRLEVAAFAAAPQHSYFVRTIEPVNDALPVPHLVTITARGPFSEVDEARFMREAGIEVIVSKNSGGGATYAKIAAARELGLPVVIVRQPALPDVPSVPSAEAALDRVRQAGTLRFV